MPVPILEGARVRLRQVTDADLDALVAIIQTPGVREWWGEADEPERLRANLVGDGGDFTTFVVEVDGQVAGWLGVAEENDPDYRSAGLDISLAPGLQARGLGPEALRTAIRWLAEERGHHRFTIDPAASNERAIKAYESVGFMPVGVMRRYERGPDGHWHDGLLMDLLIEEVR